MRLFSLRTAKACIVVSIGITGLLSANGLEMLFQGVWGDPSAFVGVYIEDAITGNEVFSKNGELRFTASSLTKLATAYAALKELDGEKRYTTTLEYTGELDRNGALKGDLIITGSGDPTLPLSIISEWGYAVRKIGITAVEGRVIADVSCFETMMASPHWEFADLGSSYAAGASALSINGNTYAVTVMPGAKVNDDVQVVSMEPAIPSLAFSNELKTGVSASAVVYGAEYSPLQVFRGFVPIGSEKHVIHAAIPDPARATVELLTKHLGIQKKPKIIRKKTQESVRKILLHTRTSPMIKQIVREMVEKGSNLFAEHILKTLGNGKASEGLLRIGRVLSDKGIEFELKDGCGAARGNFVTPKAMTLLIRNVRQDAKLAELVDAIPELGIQSALSGATCSSMARFFGEIGSMQGVWNLAGFLSLPDGRSYNFAFMVNNTTADKAQIEREVLAFFEEFVKEIF